jgi:hypothetical protein
MKPVPVPQSATDVYPFMRKINVGKPGYDGTNDGDGSTVREAATLEALIGPDLTEGGLGWPHFREFWKLDAQDLETVSAGGVLMLTFWVPQMPVHALDVYDESRGVEP